VFEATELLGARLLKAFQPLRRLISQFRTGRVSLARLFNARHPSLVGVIGGVRAARAG
jgi:hypothetical protein